MENQSGDIESLMRGLVRATSALKRKLYRYDTVASTSPEGTISPTIRVHACRICRRMAAGKDAQIKHRDGCELAKLQRAQKRLGEAWPELFAAPIKDVAVNQHPGEVCR